LVDRIFDRETFNTSVEYTQFVNDYLKTRDLPEDIKRYLNALEGIEHKTCEVCQTSQV
jgi:hypothetical protein